MPTVKSVISDSRETDESSEIARAVCVDATSRRFAGGPSDHLSVLGDREEGPAARPLVGGEIGDAVVDEGAGPHSLRALEDEGVLLVLVLEIAPNPGDVEDVLVEDAAAREVELVVPFVRRLHVTPRSLSSLRSRVEVNLRPGSSAPCFSRSAGARGPGSRAHPGRRRERASRTPRWSLPEEPESSTPSLRSPLRRGRTPPKRLRAGSSMRRRRDPCVARPSRETARRRTGARAKMASMSESLLQREVTSRSAGALTHWNWKRPRLRFAFSNFDVV